MSGVQESKVTMLPIAEWHRGYSWSRWAPWQEGGRGGRGTQAKSKRTGGRERSKND